MVLTPPRPALLPRQVHVDLEKGIASVQVRLLYLLCLQRPLWLLPLSLPRALVLALPAGAAWSACAAGGASAPPCMPLHIDGPFCFI